MFWFKVVKKIKYKINNFLKRIIWKLEYGDRLEMKPKVSFRLGMIINIDKDGIVKIGENTFFNNYCSLNSHGLIKIGNNCLFGEGVKIYDHNHIFNTYKRINEEQYKVGKVVIGSNCWIGSNVIILKGAVIGDNCTISAGSVIAGNVPENSIVKRNKSFQIVENIMRNE